MKMYYLSIFTNDELNARSEQMYGQENLFFFRVCSDYEQALRVANQGLPAGNYRNFGCMPQSFPTANSANWRVEVVYAFSRMRDAGRTARFLERHSCHPQIIGDVQKEMRAVHHIRWSRSEVSYIRWNGTKKLRHMPHGSLDVVMSIAIEWSFEDRFGIDEVSLS